MVDDLSGGCTDTYLVRPVAAQPQTPAARAMECYIGGELRRPPDACESCGCCMASLASHRYPHTGVCHTGATAGMQNGL